LVNHRGFCSGGAFAYIDQRWSWPERQQNQHSSKVTDEPDEQQSQQLLSDAVARTHQYLSSEGVKDGMAYYSLSLNLRAANEKATFVICSGRSPLRTSAGTKQPR
jgi:hypothetical protein